MLGLDPHGDWGAWKIAAFVLFWGETFFLNSSQCPKLFFEIVSSGQFFLNTVPSGLFSFFFFFFNTVPLPSGLDFFSKLHPVAYTCFQNRA